MTESNDLMGSSDNKHIYTARIHAQPKHVVTNIKKTGILDNMLIYFGTNSDKKGDQWISNEKSTLIVLGILVIVFIGSVTGFFLMWFTDVYNDSILANLVLKNGSKAAELWVNPPVNPLLRVHVFNYTNTEDYLSGRAKKLKVQDLGPYVYKETLEKVDVVYYNDSTISYREKRSYEYVPEKSSGKQYDKVMVPNVPLLSATAMVKESGMVVRISLNAGVSSTKSKVFKNLPLDSFLWGYDDPLVDLLKNFQSGISLRKFGLLANRNGTSKDSFVIHSGETDLKELSIIKGFNGQSKMDFWSTDECNRIDGTDGSRFPPHLMDKKQTLNVFIQALCRKFPLVFEKEVTLFEGIPAWRYRAPDAVFSHPNANPDNQCYCHLESGTCPPSGLYNATLCNDGAPILASFPHFYQGDPELLENIEGLNPIRELHETYADIHPRLAFPIDGASRFQINVQIQKAGFVTGFEKFKDNMILPIIWLEVIPGDISEELRAMIYHSTFSANAIQLSLRYGSLLVFVASFALLATLCYCRGKSNESSDVINFERANNEEFAKLGSKVIEVKHQKNNAPTNNAEGLEL